MRGIAGLLQLVSVGLPVGGFAYSRGLETAVERGWVCDRASARDWVEGLFDHSVTRLDAPLVARLHDAWSEGDLAEVHPWVTLADASRETDELQRESRAMGGALTRLLVDLALDVPDAALAARSYVGAFALGAMRLGVGRADAVRGFLFAWLEAGVVATVKLVPLGQTDGQRMLLALGARLDEATDAVLALPDEDVGALVPGFALASALHETQHTRLYRS